MPPRFDSSAPGSASYTVRLRNSEQRCATSAFAMLKDLFDVSAEMAGEQGLDVPGSGARTEEQLRASYLQLYPTTQDGDNAVAWDSFHMNLLEAALRRLDQDHYADAVAMDNDRQEVSTDTIKSLIWVTNYGPRLTGSGGSVPIENIVLPDIVPLPRFGTAINPPPGGVTQSVSCETVPTDVAYWKSPNMAWATIPTWLLVLAGIVVIGTVTTVAYLFVRARNEKKLEEKKKAEASPQEMAS